MLLLLSPPPPPLLLLPLPLLVGTPYTPPAAQTKSRSEAWAETSACSSTLLA